MAANATPASDTVWRHNDEEATVTA
jgi:hypothetical protein